MNPAFDDPSDEIAIRDMLGALRQKHLEPAWDALDEVDATRFGALRSALAETGLTAAALPEEAGGVPLSAPGRYAALSALGAAHPALAAALVSHLTAQALVVEANGGLWPAALPADGHYALVGSPLDAAPMTPFRLDGTAGARGLSGSRRAMTCHADYLVVPATAADGLYLCVVPAASEGLALHDTPSSHGLCLMPFGVLEAGDVAVDDARLFAFPATGHAAHEADGLLAALVAGMIDEVATRAIDYARQRPQAGRMIIEHHAVQQLVGPIEMARRPLRALAIATLGESRSRAGDGSAAAFAIQIARRAALDAIQTFGGYGYMQDYRVERYLRDANTLETFWIHAAARERDAASRRSNALSRGEAA